MGNALWPTSHDEALIGYRDDGFSFTDCQTKINDKFGTTYSRNACIGRAKRLGLLQTPEEIRIRRSQAAVKREETKRLREERGMTKVRRRCKRGRNGLTFAAAPVTEKEITGLLRVKPASIPLGSFASRILHTVKRVEADKAQEPRKRSFGDTGTVDNRPLRCAEVTPLHLSLMDLKPDCCRWPYGGYPGNDPITFCGHPMFMRSYCMAHYQLSIGNGTPSERAAHRVSERDAA